MLSRRDTKHKTQSHSKLRSVFTPETTKTAAKMLNPKTPRSELPETSSLRGQQREETVGPNPAGIRKEC